MKEKINMKLLVCMFLLFITIFSTNGQSASGDFTFKIRKVNTDKEPSFPGGEMALSSYLAQNIKFPKKLEKADFAAIVKVKCFVSETGQLEQITVIESCGEKACDAEAVRVVKTMPDWLPGQRNGMPMRLPVIIPVLFSKSSETNDNTFEVIISE